MSNEYKKQITERIKERVNNWIEELKGKHPELLITKQWKPRFPAGFKPGHIVIPVVTTSKQGKHLVAEVQFFLDESMDFEPESIELVLKDEPYSEPELPKKVSPIPMDEPLDVLNEIVAGLNSFLTGLNLPTTTQNPVSTSLFPLSNSSKPIKVVSNLSPNATDEISSVGRQMLNSPHLPDWFKTIYSREVREGLLEKLAEGYVHYCRQVGRKVELKDFFDVYTEHLKKQNKLHLFCSYQGKPVVFDANNECTEHYCSKKPYNATCPIANLKFGAAPDK
ncbi:MAG: hypothetical protein CV087_21790 [Candidatus Brocadia sp. WS118]|nr:MAG: hypothetical protein CV087_21790 [Candidatus Brocadia sp. WS118]